MWFGDPLHTLISRLCFTVTFTATEATMPDEIHIPDDGEIAPVFAALARAYAVTVEASASERLKLLGDRERTARRADALEKFLEALRAVAQRIADLADVDGVRAAGKHLRALPEALRPKKEAS